MKKQAGNKGVTGLGWQQAKPLIPKNTQQERYMTAIKDMPIVIATGYAGTGKTYIPARIAASLLQQKQIESIVLTRPNISRSRSLGYFPGTKNEKMDEWLAPVLSALHEEFPPHVLKGMLHPEYGNVTMCPLETIKGRSIANAFMIVDEAEDLTIDEIKKILTRIGYGSKIVLCGDTSQSDMIGKCGLLTFINAMKHDTDFQSVIEHINFGNVNSIVRSLTCRKLILGFDRMGM